MHQVQLEARKNAHGIAAATERPGDDAPGAWGAGRLGTPVGASVGAVTC